MAGEAPPMSQPVSLDGSVHGGSWSSSGSESLANRSRIAVCSSATGTGISCDNSLSEDVAVRTRMLSTSDLKELTWSDIPSLAEARNQMAAGRSDHCDGRSVSSAKRPLAGADATSDAPRAIRPLIRSGTTPHNAICRNTHRPLRHTAYRRVPRVRPPGVN